MRRAFLMNAGEHYVCAKKPPPKSGVSSDRHEGTWRDPLLDWMKSRLGKCRTGPRDFSPRTSAQR
jgi:hypothetical protein